MKFLLYVFVIFLAFNLPVNAQHIDPYSRLNSVLPTKIQVSSNATTVIAFPYTVIDVDCGVGVLRAEKVTGLGNILKIKFSTPSGDTTNLHVFTADGTIHAFEVSWHPAPAITTYNMNLDRSNPVALSANQYTTEINEKELLSMIEEVKTRKPFLHRTNRKFQIKLSLHGVYVHNNILFLRFQISNRSRLAYQAGWTSLYIADKKTARRSSVQQLAVSPVHTDALPFIEGKHRQEWIIAIPRTTIPDRKKMTFELHEQNGGRHITITIRNKILFKAQKI